MNTLTIYETKNINNFMYLINRKHKHTHEHKNQKTKNIKKVALHTFFLQIRIEIDGGWNQKSVSELKSKSMAVVKSEIIHMYISEIEIDGYCKIRNRFLILNTQNRFRFMATNQKSVKKMERKSVKKMKSKQK